MLRENDHPVRVQSSKTSTMRHLGYFFLVTLSILGGVLMAIWPLFATYYHVSRTELAHWGLRKVFIMDEAYGLAVFLIYQTIRMSFRTRRWKWFHERIYARWWWRDNWYESVQIVFQNETSRKLLATPMSKSLFCVHPHGIYSMGIMNLLCSDEAVYSGELKALISVNVLWIPFFADVLEWAGCRSTRKSTMKMLMKQRETMALVPGGFHEAGFHHYGNDTVYVSTGFVKYSLQYGYSVVPCFTFGENMTCKMLFQFPEWFRRTIGDMELPMVGPFYSTYGVVPERNTNLVTVVGDPIPFPTITHPSSEDIVHYQGIYIKALRKLFDQHKHRYGNGTATKLEIYNRIRKGTKYQKVS